MQRQRAFGTQLHFQLPYRFQERLRFDITHGATDFHQGHIGAFCAFQHPAFDFVGDVRNYLHGTTQIIATALFGQHVGVNTTGGEVIAARHGSADKALVMTEVEVGFSAVVGDEHFTVLERAHGTRINVDVRVQLEHGDLQATGLKNGRQRSRGDAFPQ